MVEPEWVQPWLCPHKHAANVACCARCCCTRDCLERAAIIRRSFAFRLSVTVTRSGYALQTPDAFRPRSLPPPFLPLFSPFSPSSFFHASFLSSFLFFFRSFQRRTKARWLVRKSAGHYASFVSFLFRAALLAPLHNHVEQRSHSSDQFTVENFWSRRFFPPWRKKQQGERKRILHRFWETTLVDNAITWSTLVILRRDARRSSSQILARITRRYRMQLALTREICSILDFGNSWKFSSFTIGIN